MSLDPTAPGYFRCEKLRVTLRKRSCAMRHAEAERADDDGDVVRLFECIGCPIGREHAKEELVRIRTTRRKGQFNRYQTSS